MRATFRRAASVLAMALASGSAAAGQNAAPAIPVYDATQVSLDRFTVVKRVGVEGWQSAFWIPAHRDLESARQAVVSEAARAGADAVVNVTCFDQTDGFFTRSGYFCYGNAVRQKK